MSIGIHPPQSLVSVLGDPAGSNRQEIMHRVRAIDETLWLHAQSVAGYVTMFASVQETRDLDHASVIDAAWLHDIGKLTIARATLDKSGPLDADDWVTVHAHPASAADYLERAPGFSTVGKLVRSHHEWFDGRGYPDGLIGQEIPLGSRLIGIADAYDAMTTWRPYRRPYERAEAILELRRCSGSQFDPDLVEGFIASTSIAFEESHA